MPDSLMSNSRGESADIIRHEIAIGAARLIAQCGLDYGSAKRKAAAEIVGKRRVPDNFLPDNDAIEDEVRAYQQLFQQDSQPARLASLRRTALELMKFLGEFSPYLTGAALNGTAGEYSGICLEVFVDSAKDLEIFLLNHRVRFEAHEAARTKGRPAVFEPFEALTFVWERSQGAGREGVQLTVYETTALRGALSGSRGRDRADIAGVELLLAAAVQTPVSSPGQAG